MSGCSHTHGRTPGIPEALDELRRWARLAVLTNKPGAATARILDGLGLRPGFEWVIGGDAPSGASRIPPVFCGWCAQAGADARRR